MLRQIIHSCLLAAVALSLLAAPALATATPSPETCGGLLTIAVFCYTCEGEKLDRVLIDPEFNESETSCVSHHDDIRTQCAKLNNGNNNLEMRWTYSLRTSEYSGHKRYCD